MLNRRLQIELLKLQRRCKRTGARHVIVFEDRDAAGNGGTIRRFIEHLNPHRRPRGRARKAHREDKSQWDFQRYVTHLPTHGEMVLFDRSWYNRTGVEKVMGFCTPEQHAEFMCQARFSSRLVNEGIHLTKFWFSVSPVEQRTRFAIRLVDPLRHWKLSDMDMKSVRRWDAYTEAKKQMFPATDTDYAPWIAVKSNDSKSGCLNAMRHLLSKFVRRQRARHRRWAHTL